MTIEIIAELAQGFEGKSEQAFLLMKAAATGGASAVKYQLVFADELATPDYKYYELFKSLEMPDESWERLSDSAKKLKINLQLDIFGSRSLKLAEYLNVSAVKLHGTDIANIGLLKEVAQSSVKKILLGAGGAHLDELSQAIDILNAKEVVVLLGFQGYPTPNNSNEISRVSLLKQYFLKKYPHVKIGFADHASPESTLRFALATMAIGAGAEVIEKHLTLGRTMKLEDNESALNPDEFLVFSNTIKECALALGHSTLIEDFGMSESEKGYRKMIRRHVVAAVRLSAGDQLQPSQLSLKRTSAENPITDLSSVYSKTIKSAIEINRPILLKDIK
ncbi:SpsE Sialic acid synthase [Candidatus Methylopumilus universalis]|uniref:N-acetylneuraminate synthase family protein n=1 Tax=Candidatus Methylopumilus universalis TaxID=2588536 RepID=UPI003BEEDCA2